MNLEQRHMLNSIRKDITTIEIELQPGPGEDTDPHLIEEAANRIRGRLDDLIDQSQGIG